MLSDTISFIPLINDESLSQIVSTLDSIVRFARDSWQTQDKVQLLCMCPKMRVGELSPIAKSRGFRIGDESRQDNLDEHQHFQKQPLLANLASLSLIKIWGTCGMFIKPGYVFREESDSLHQSAIQAVAKDWLLLYLSARTKSRGLPVWGIFSPTLLQNSLPPGLYKCLEVTHQKPFLGKSHYHQEATRAAHFDVPWVLATLAANYHNGTRSLSDRGKRTQVIHAHWESEVA